MEFHLQNGTPYLLPKQSHHFDICLGDMRVETVRGTTVPKRGFIWIAEKSAGVPLYRDVGLVRCNSLRIGHDHSYGVFCFFGGRDCAS